MQNMFTKQNRNKLLITKNIWKISTPWKLSNTILNSHLIKENKKIFFNDDITLKFLICS